MPESDSDSDDFLADYLAASRAEYKKKPENANLVTNSRPKKSIKRYW